MKLLSAIASLPRKIIIGGSVGLTVVAALLGTGVYFFLKHAPAPSIAQPSQIATNSTSGKKSGSSTPSSNSSKQANSQQPASPACKAQPTLPACKTNPSNPNPTSTTSSGGTSAANGSSGASSGGSSSSSGGGSSGGSSGGGSSGGGGSNSSSSSCPLPQYPTPSCTGVPGGATSASYTNTVNGDYTVTQNGTVINGWHITGYLIIEATDVQISNTWVEGSITDDNALSSTFSVTDSTVGPAVGCVGLPGIFSANFTAERVLVQRHDNGFQLSAPGATATVRDSFAETCGLEPMNSSHVEIGDYDPSCAFNCPDGSHSDGFSAWCNTGPCGSAYFDHDTLIVGTDDVTAAFYAGAGGGNGYPIGVTLKNSLLSGGGTGPGTLLNPNDPIGTPYVIYLAWQSGPDYTIMNNSVVNNTWAYGATTAEGSCAHQNWSGNRIVTVNSNFQVTSTVASINCSG